MTGVSYRGANLPAVAQPAVRPGALWPVLDADGCGVDPALPLYATTFVVVDLETTGGAPDGGGITEIGAVKVRGGEQLGVLRHPGQPGRADPAVHHRADRHHRGHAGCRRRRSSRCCRACWSSSRGAVLVAHNAPYDVGFLKAACARHGYRWPNPRVLDTAALARRVLTRDEVPNRKLGTLAAYFRTATQPTHRALDDARATVDVLHGLIEPARRPPGATRVGDAIEFARAVTPTQRRKRHLADGLPKVPGRLHLPGRRRPAALRRHVRRHRHPGAQLLHRRREAGPDLRDARRGRAGRGGRVRPLAGGGGPRAAADRRARAAVQPAVEIPGADGLAQADRRGRTRGCRWCAELAADGAAYLGPFSSRRAAELAAAGVYDAVPLRQCTHRLSLRTVTPACALAELGRCPAPCEHKITPEEYDDARRRAVPHGHRRRPASRWWTRCWPGSRRSPAGQRYEEAAVVRSRLVALLRATVRMQRLAALTRHRRAGRRPPGRPGRLGDRRGPARPARRARAPPRRACTRARRSTTIRATAETVLPGPGPVPAATAEETERILAWLERPETRLVESLRRLGVPGSVARRASVTCSAKAESGSVRTKTRPNAHDATDRSD